MPHPSRTVILKASGAAAASAAEAEVVIPELFTAVIVMLDVTVASGTSPTLNVYIQQAIRQQGTAVSVGSDVDGALFWDDYAAFTQVTTTGKRFWRIVGGGNEESAASDAALTAGTCRDGPLGSIFRCKYVIGGTNPSLNFSVVAQFIS